MKGEPESALSSTSCRDPRRDLRRWGSGEDLLLLLPLPIARLASPRALSVAPAPCPTKCRADSGALRWHRFFSSPPCHTLGSVQPYDSCVLRAGDGGDGAVEGAAEAAPVVHSKRRLRLFGVNLECAPDLEEAADGEIGVRFSGEIGVRFSEPNCAHANPVGTLLLVLHCRSRRKQSYCSENITSTNKVEVSLNTAANAKKT
uniref:Uncharacterized protein n=1 Tax=Ananas comosus var. bracteatus TaxID=296719 RepID=A0A6V7NLP7_ANACO|nr:unnamed protein product [Ananas comosus var. bracteatus]